jgi:hypothetical protein
MSSLWVFVWFTIPIYYRIFIPSRMVGAIDKSID